MKFSNILAKETRPDSTDVPGCSLDWKPSSIPPMAPSSTSTSICCCWSFLGGIFQLVLTSDTTCNV
ncbi:hypothetical protein FQN60_013285 [Etheostoma spectabile]|uniref:Uncharacterized protein n=1 Tax=Etheostoma spectabile TaxID=54343 RepID=A0A5J5DAM0_9PERO|nr:hypothetical protein FQN60_013285 [Etheostoma spectabile]